MQYCTMWFESLLKIRYAIQKCEMNSVMLRDYGIEYLMLYYKRKREEYKNITLFHTYDMVKKSIIQ